MSQGKRQCLWVLNEGFELLFLTFLNYATTLLGGCGVWLSNMAVLARATARIGEIQDGCKGCEAVTQRRCIPKSKTPAKRSRPA